MRKQRSTILPLCSPSTNPIKSASIFKCHMVVGLRDFFKEGRQAWPIIFLDLPPERFHYSSRQIERMEKENRLPSKTIHIGDWTNRPKRQNGRWKVTGRIRNFTIHQIHTTTWRFIQSLPGTCNRRAGLFQPSLSKFVGHRQNLHGYIALIVDPESLGIVSGKL